MKRIFLLAGYLLGAGVAACSAAVVGSHPYYVTRPARTVQSIYTEPAIVFIDDRTLMWMNGAMLRARFNDLEGAGCGHIAKQVGDGFYVDSIMAVRGSATFTPWSARFHCNPGEAPIHWHPNLTETMCELSTPETSGEGSDVDPAWSTVPFNMMMCGLGIDSVVVYKVRATPNVAGRNHGKGK